MNVLLQKLKLGAARLSSPSAYCYTDVLQLDIKTQRNGNVQEPRTALNVRYVSSIPKPDSIGRLSPEREVEFMKTQVAEMPECPKNFPRREFYNVCKIQEYDTGLIRVGEWSNIHSLDLEKIARGESDIGFTKVYILALNSYNNGKTLNNLYTPLGRFSFPLWDFYNALSKAGHTIKSCNVRVETMWSGPAWMGLPSEHEPPTIHGLHSFPINISEISRTLQEFSRYCQERDLQRDYARKIEPAVA